MCRDPLECHISLYAKSGQSSGEFIQLLYMVLESLKHDILQDIPRLAAWPDETPWGRVRRAEVNPYPSSICLLRELTPLFPMHGPRVGVSRD